MKFDLVIFDLDGTLVNTIADLGAAVNAALRVQGLPLHELEEYKGMVGHGVRNLVRKAVPERLRGDEAALDGLLAIFLKYYLAHIDVYSRPYPGIPALLAELEDAGVQIAIATNKFQAGAEKLARSIFPQLRFSALCGGGPERPLKPDPAIIRDILARTGVRPERAVMVGDSGTDLATAAAAGVASVAVTWGFRPAESLSGAGRMVHTVAELRAALLEA